MSTKQKRDASEEMKTNQDVKGKIGALVYKDETTAAIRYSEEETVAAINSVWV
jgi:hypothetical protein